jgi:large subunit ribosomal protein L23
MNRILLYPIATEKAVNNIERDNIITYIVDARATRVEVRNAFEKTFGVKVNKINIIRTPDNTKKAVIKIDASSKAADIALKLKLI